MGNARSHQSVLDCIGHTPLVRLNRMFADSPAEVYAKLEFMNPSGSIKDRIARYMIERAEQDGRLKPGDLILENSSGNTALSLAMVGLQKGYRVKVVVRDRVSREKLDQLHALGVDVVMADSSLPPEHPDSYNNITPRLAAQTPNCYFPDQHGNRENNDAHYATTGPEIWEQMEGRIDYFPGGRRDRRHPGRRGALSQGAGPPDQGHRHRRPGLGVPRVLPPQADGATR